MSTANLLDPPLSPGELDSDSADPLIRLRKAALITAQIQQLGAAAVAPVTCPCGQTTPLSLACRCLECGIFFCRGCAERHFLKAPV